MIKKQTALELLTLLAGLLTFLFLLCLAAVLVFDPPNVVNIENCVELNTPGLYECAINVENKTK